MILYCIFYVKSAEFRKKWKYSALFTKYAVKSEFDGTFYVNSAIFLTFYVNNAVLQLTLLTCLVLCVGSWLLLDYITSMDLDNTDDMIYHDDGFDDFMDQQHGLMDISIGFDDDTNRQHHW